MKQRFGKATKYSSGEIRAWDHEHVYQEGDSSWYIMIQKYHLQKIILEIGRVRRKAACQKVVPMILTLTLECQMIQGNRWKNV